MALFRKQSKGYLPRYAHISSAWWKRRKSCSHDQVLYSSGVHISENGSVKVCDNEDAFHCPNCDEQDTPELQSAIENDDPFEVLWGHKVENAESVSVKVFLLIWRRFLNRLRVFHFMGA